MKRFKTALLTGTALSMLTMGSAFAENAGLTAAGTAITAAGTDAVTAAGPVIAGAVGVGVVFWGAKLLWNKFKSMAK